MVALPAQYQYRKTPITAVVPIVRLTPSFSYEHFLHRAALLFKRTLCYYSLIYYTGDKRAKEPPVIGVLVICPGSQVVDIHWDLRNSSLLPYSKRWKEVRDRLKEFEAMTPDTPRMLELERRDRARIKGRHHLLDLSPVQITFDHPELAAKHLYEEHSMGKENHRRSVHEQIEKHKHTMDLDDIEFYATLVEERLEETRQKDMLTLLFAFGLYVTNGNDDQRRRVQHLMNITELVIGL